VTALAVDDDGRTWVGTWGEGVYRRDAGGDWIPYRVQNGLASDYVLAAAADGGAVWFGTRPYFSAQGSRGGIGRYDLATESWRVYTTAHGLPADTLFSEAPAYAYALAMGEGGIPWAGTAGGVWFLATEDWWAGYTTAYGLRPGAVKALVVGSGTAVAATPPGLDRIDPFATPGARPVAQIDLVSPPTLTVGTTLMLSGSGWDEDESGERVVAWDWSSSLDGPVCTTAACVLPYDLFTSGVHTVTLRVQDDEGIWSVPVTATVVVQEPRRVYLPLVLNQSEG
jgi:hypothetical protein